VKNRRSIELEGLLADYRLIIRHAARFAMQDDELGRQRRRLLQAEAEIMLDDSSGLNARNLLEASLRVHAGPVLAVKVKRLKDLRVCREGLRGDIVRAIGDAISHRTSNGFAGYFGRMYVLVDGPEFARELTTVLRARLEVIRDSLREMDVPDEELPYLLTGIGRTSEEAWLVTRGRVAQEAVPLAVDG
jgi:hypothetical protein